MELLSILFLYEIFNIRFIPSMMMQLQVPRTCGHKAISLRIDGRFGSWNWWTIFGLTLPPKCANDETKNKTYGAPFTIHNEMALLCLNAKTLPILIWTFKIGFYSNFFFILIFFLYFLFRISFWSCRMKCYISELN